MYREMKMKLLGIAAGLATALTLYSSASAIAATQISWWHAMTGANAEVVDKIAKDFNASQSDY
jgi:sn-glycerol 3-phosphate transport system substrate-binding protein